MVWIFFNLALIEFIKYARPGRCWSPQAPYVPSHCPRGGWQKSSRPGRLSHCWPNHPTQMGGRQRQRTARPLIYKDLLVTLLTIYDKCKAVDKTMVMSDIKVMEKHGGKSGCWKVE